MAGRTTSQTLAELEEIQAAGVSLAEAVKSLHLKENVALDDIWPAIMLLKGITKKDAEYLVDQWCGH